MEILGYEDSSYTRDLKDKKSLTKYCFFLGKEIVTYW